MQSWLARLVARWSTGVRRNPTKSSTPTRTHASFAASGVSERNVTQGVDWNAVYRDRYSYDRAKVMDEALVAWRLNPLARRIVEIQTQYTTDGIGFTCDDEAALKFLKDFWNHPLNKLGEHLKEWSDELALTGNLFVCITTDAAGMSYLRIFPSDMIDEIVTASNDVQQELAYLPRPSANDPQPKAIPAYAAARGRKMKAVMLHYSVNRLAGMSWGEPDIAPLLPWLARYASWLEDRMRLNRFRQAYLYVVKGTYASQAEKKQRQQELSNNPPNPGSILVTDTSEEWQVINPRLDSFEANNDGLALKKFIAGGRGYPLHWLAEPESSTRTTAEAAGTPTFKGLESRQQMFLSMVKDILTVAAKRAGFSIEASTITVTAADISERDNAALALASTQVIASFGQLWANGFIDDAEYLRVVYRFAGEAVPTDRPDSPRPQAVARPAGAKPGAAPNLKVDAETGDVKVKEPR
jgi:hypothetical protein